MSMVSMPSPIKAFEYDNSLHYNCDPSRIGKFIVHYELFKMIRHLEGAIVECGVFKGASFSRFAGFRQLMGDPGRQKLVGFDMFGSENPVARLLQKTSLKSSSISEAISMEQLTDALAAKGLSENVELIEGDLTESIPAYLIKNPEFKIALLKMDVEVSESTSTVLDYLYPRLLNGGVMILDDYNRFAGETRSVDEYFQGKNVPIRKFAFSKGPYYIVKNEY